MPEVCKPCLCIPYENICCCPSQNGITVAQPKCQVVPNGDVVTNPCFNVDDNISYWTYKFITNCDRETRGISTILIPVCNTISERAITVEEKIDSCSEFNPIKYLLEDSDPNFGPAPEGFNFLKIETTDRYDKGVCVTYRISILGNYAEAVQNINIKASTDFYEFGCEDCYIVPGCPPIPKILVKKDCDQVIRDNKVSLLYTVNIENVGNITLDNVQFNDNITFDPANIVIDAVTVDPSLIIDQGTSGLIAITGSLGDLNPGDGLQVEIKVTIRNINNPGTYMITQNAKAACCQTESSDSCMLNIEAVKLVGEKCCAIGDTINSRIFRIKITNVGNSPDTNVKFTDRMVIPKGVTVQFTNFNGCNAIYADTLDPVILNTDVTDKTLIISSDNINVSTGSSISKDIVFNIMSTSAFENPVEIINVLENVEFLNTDEQVFLGIDNVPDTAKIEVRGLVNCLDPCEG